MSSGIMFERVFSLGFQGPQVSTRCHVACLRDLLCYCAAIALLEDIIRVDGSFGV